VKSKAIADILSALNDECGRLQALETSGVRPSDEEWERVRVVLRAYDAIGKI
jgi:hypothetical protein